MTEPASTQLCRAWATESDLPDTRPDLPPPTTWDELLLAASEILWALSGRQWSGTPEEGGCEASATLVRDQGSCVGWYLGWAPMIYGAVPMVAAPAARQQQAMKLPHDEVTEVVSMTVGEEPFTSYRRMGSWLWRTDHHGWNEFADDVVVTYRWGVAPPEGGKRSVIAYALELGKAIVGDSSCRLPKRVTTITRQGVSMTLIDPQRYLDNGKLGIPDIDQWLAAVNPQAQPERGSVWSPDVPRAQPL